MTSAACEKEAAGDPAASARGELRRFWELHDRAKDLYASGQYAAAAAAYAGVLAIDGRHPASLYNLAHAEFILGRHRSALEHLRLLQEIDPHETKAYLLAATIHMDPRPWAPFDLAAADALIEKALGVNREESGPFLLEGRSALLAGDLGRAAERLRLALRLNPKCAEAANLLGIIALRRGDASGAMELFSSAVPAAKGSPPPAGLAGEGDTRKGGAGSHEEQRLQGVWLSLLASEIAGSPDPSASAEGGREGPWLREADARIRRLPGRRSGGAVAAGDFDGDGSMDLAAGSLAGPISLFAGTASGFESGGSVDPRGAAVLLAFDDDGDGRDDLVAWRGGAFTSGCPALLVSRGRVGGALLFQVTDLPGPERRVLAAAAVRGAGILEVGPAARDLGCVRTLERRGDGWVLSPVRGLPVDACALGLAVLDSGEVPVAAVGLAGRPPALIVRDASGWRAVPSPAGLEAAGAAEHLAALDLDGDGRLDLALASGSPHSAVLGWLTEGKAEGSPVRLLRRVGTAEFEPMALEVPAFASSASGLVAGDIDGDGRDDLVILGGGPEPWLVEPWWLLLRGEAGFGLFRGSMPPGTLGTSGAAILSASSGSTDRRGGTVAIAGGGGLPWDRGEAFLVDTRPGSRASR